MNPRPASRRELTVDRDSVGTIESKEPSVGLFNSKLPPRSTAGQLTLDQHIGVRIPGGQPIIFNHLRQLLLQPLPDLVRPWCGLVQVCVRIETIHAANVGARQPGDHRCPQ